MSRGSKSGSALSVGIKPEDIPLFRPASPLYLKTLVVSRDLLSSVGEGNTCNIRLPLGFGVITWEHDLLALCFSSP